MKSTDDRSLIPVAIATDAAPEYIRAIPTTQATTGDGSVSIDLGFPPECAISSTAGGKRPEMKDVNGVYNLLSAAIRSLQAYYGLYSSDFATGIGGYPNQALVQDSSGNFWVSTADNNLTAPGTSGASWKSLFDGYAKLNAGANFLSLSTTNTLDLSDNGNNVPTTYWVKAQNYATEAYVKGTFVPGATGYEIKPSGEIEQWGTYATSPSGLVTVYFPLPFPNACDNIGLNESNAAGTWTVNTPTLHGVNQAPNASAFIANVRIWDANNNSWQPGEATGYWRAIGH